MTRPTLRYEKQLHAAGHLRVAGIDEVGRGPLAGPVCAAAAVLPAGFTHKLLNDSKKLTPTRREEIYAELTTDPHIHWSVILVEVAEIDRINILQATRVAMRRAVLELPHPASAALIDGLPVPDFPLPQQALVKGDSLSYSIAAASVIAKVTRDRLMVQLAQQYPAYGFEIHKGYPTPKHLAALRQHGPCPAHRRSFAPVAQMQLAYETRTTPKNID
jgi:ribonuclease HII